MLNLKQQPPRVGFVSLGCPKASTDAEHILTRLRAEGYEVAPNYDGADLVIVNTCGFIDAAVEESLDAIGEALNENGKVIVTGCLGAKKDAAGKGIVEQVHPKVLAVTGPHATEEVMTAVHQYVPKPHDPFSDLVPPQGVRLTPDHFAYLKISEGCNHRCTFCIIPSLRGDLVSRPIHEVMQEAESLVKAGVNELHVWVRLHYVYPYPSVDDIIPLMAEGKILPYLDVPFQHANSRILKLMKRPASAENNLERIRRWREICPDLTIRSTFITGFPGETEQEFEELLQFLEEARLDRVGCFSYSPVEGAAANALPDPVPEEIREERKARLMALQEDISTQRLEAKIGREIVVLVDDVDEEGAIARSEGDAPDIDGLVYVPDGHDMEVGKFYRVRVTDCDVHDLYAEPVYSDEP
ncbi:MAG: ribosomal protein S12 methylthiotransferase [Uliginosibacterium sp.]|nr:ribosomal protein S12 methylthiotransferase [Uliginosibacterium sp.]